MSATKADTGQHHKTCIVVTTQVLGDKWTPMLLLALSGTGRRFCELQTEAGGVNPRTLSARLGKLEKTGIIKRTVYPGAPSRVEYELTKKGRDLLPVIKDMIAWADKYGLAPLSA